MTDSISTPEKTPNRSFTRPTQMQSFEIGKLLHEHCRTEEVDGHKIAVYAEGWDDRRIAEQVGVVPAAVEYRRVQMIGKFPQAVKQAVTKARREKGVLTDLQALQAVTDAITGMSERQDKLAGILTALAERLVSVDLRLERISDQVHRLDQLVNGQGLTVNEIHRQLAACKTEYAGLREQVEKLF